MTTHYWVFSDEQLAEALDAYFGAAPPEADAGHSTRAASGNAARDVVVEFLHSSAVVERGMRRE